MSDITSIKVRMYNTGSVGDCILLLFYVKKNISFKMLIDCGGWQTSPADIQRCVQDIHGETGGVLDLLVVTHQHMDHISGFNQAKSIFDTFTVHNVWMSWIENEIDPIGIILREKYGKKVKELKRMAKRAIAEIKKQARKEFTVVGTGRRLNRREVRMNNTLSLLEFEEGLGLGAKAAKTNDDAMKYVKDISNNLEYRTPGEVLTMSGASGVKFFILGPPRDQDMKYFKRPEVEEELYHFKAKADQDEPVSESLPNFVVPPGVLLEDGFSPFKKDHHMTESDLRKFWREYNSTDHNWRQIETDHLETAASIALRVNSLLNNTSLAMAIEFGKNKKIILLPADAQSGNWMGWHKDDVVSALKSNGGRTTKEILNNTVFYKVGHHGSHNGTASMSGLEQMTSPDLVAMIPVVKDKIPSAWGGPKNFPAAGLFGVLLEKTKGRVIRLDEGVVKTPEAVAQRKKLSANAAKEFKKSQGIGAFYVEYTLSE